MTLTTKRWMQAALAAFLGAVWISVAAALLDPATFNLMTWTGVVYLGAMGAVGALGHLGMYLAQSPLPEADETVAA